MTQAASDEKEKAIFHAAHSIRDAEQRETYLQAACEGDSELRELVDALLSAAEDGSFMEQPAAERWTTGQSPQASEAVGTKIGNYKLLEQIGEGGFGVVYMAEQKQPVRRRVALKIIKLGMDTRQVVARFEAERQALAMMDHPSIAKVLDAGTTDTGRPYFVMELVRGTPITDFCDENRLSARERLALFTQVCLAVQHAHQKGIIHRDIKPSNVLVALYDDQPVPKVIDFGVAKATEHRLTEKTVFTQHRQFIGTPTYMSPEQAAFNNLDVDTRSDVYSLGILLYELLTGTTPFDEQRLRGMAYDELCRAIREEIPPTPSTRVTTLGEQLSVVCQRRSTQPGLIVRLLRGDVDWIVMKAVEKDRRRRYESASALAHDIQRHLDNKPVWAGPPSTLYRLQKFVARNWVAVFCTAAVVFALVAGTVAATAGFVRARRAQQSAESALIETQQARQQADLNRYVSDMNRAVKAYDEADLDLALSLLETHRTTHGETFEWRCLYWLCQTGDAIHTFREHSGAVNSVAFSKQGVLASGSADGSFKLFDIGSRREIDGHRHTSAIRCVAFSPDGQTLAVAAETDDVTLWRVNPLDCLGTLVHDGDIQAMAFSPDGSTLAVSVDMTRWKGNIHLWDWRSRQELATLPEGPHGLAFSYADGALLAAAGPTLTVHLWGMSDLDNIRPWASIGQAHDMWLKDATFSPDGEFLATSSWDTLIAIWEVAALRETDENDVSKPLAMLRRHRSKVNSLAFSPDNRFLASASDDNTVKLWPGIPPWGPDQEDLVTLRGHTAPVTSLAFSPDGEFIASGSADHTIKIWAGDGRREANVLRGYDDWVFTVAFSPDDRILATGGFDGRVVLWDTETMKKEFDQRLHEHQVLTVAFSPDGKWLASCDAVWRYDTKRGITFDTPGQVQLLDLSDHRVVPIPLPKKAGVRALDFSVDGSVLAIGDHNGRLWIWGIEQRNVLNSQPLGSDVIIRKLLFSPDGDTIAVSSFAESSRHQPPVRILDSRTLEEIAITGGAGLVFSPDGTTLAIGEQDQVKLWDVISHQPRGVFTGHQSEIRSAVFSPDGGTLATASIDHTVKLWNIASGREVATLIGHRGPVSGLALSHDGTMLASSSEDRTVRIWRAVPKGVGQ